MTDKKTQAKHWAGKDQRIIKSYWDSPPATVRSKWFVEQLKNYEFDSIFEIGFFAGRNLKYISEAFPDASVGGLEVNPKAVRFAREKLPNCNLLHFDLHELSDISGVSDIVFTSGVLIHVPPEDLTSAIKQMISRAARYVMHLEQLGKNEVCAGPKKFKPTYKVSDQIQWNPDLVEVYEGLGYKPEVIQLPDECKTNGARELVVVRIGD